jgi:hypothetical protein
MAAPRLGSAARHRLDARGGKTSQTP